jgi:hypothetical protein
MTEDKMDNVCNWLVDHPWMAGFLIAATIRLAFYADTVLP